MVTLKILQIVALVDNGTIGKAKKKISVVRVTAEKISGRVGRPFFFFLVFAFAMAILSFVIYFVKITLSFWSIYKAHDTTTLNL